MRLQAGALARRWQTDNDMTTPIADLARAYDSLHKGLGICPSPPTERSIRHINEVLSIRLPDSLVWFAANTGACHNWIARLGEDFEHHHHILYLAALARKIRRRVIGGGGRWEYVKPAAFVPFTHGYDSDYDCLDSGSVDPSTGEYAIQYWAPPRILGEERYSSFPQYMEASIKSWAECAHPPVKDTVLAIIGNSNSGRHTG
jgi:hypothetical protein